MTLAFPRSTPFFLHSFLHTRSVTPPAPPRMQLSVCPISRSAPPPPIDLHIYRCLLRAQLLAHTLVRRRVLRPVPLVTIHRGLAPYALDQCSSLAPGEIAGTSQLVAEALVLGPVECGVLPRAVQRDPAPCAFVQGRALSLHPARRVLALSDFPLPIPLAPLEISILFLIRE